MSSKDFGPRRPGGKIDKEKMDRIVSQARQAWGEREQGYREQSLRIHPWVCARCGREFTLKTLHELTVHHKDHDHDNNPPDGSNWENLCIYCHDNEHKRYLDYSAGAGADVGGEEKKTGLQRPFADLKDLLKAKKSK